MKSLLLLFAGSVVVLSASGCGNTDARQDTTLAKHERRLNENDQNWETQLTVNDRLNRQAQNIGSRSGGGSSAQSQLGGGPTSHLPSHIGGVPVIRGVRPHSADDPRFQWTTMYDPATGTPYVREMPVQAVGPMAGYPPTAQPSGGQVPTAAPPPYVPPPPQATSPAAPAAPVSTTKDEIERIDRVNRKLRKGLAQEKSPKKDVDLDEAVARGGLSSIPALRSQIQDVTGLVRDFKDLQEVFGGGQQNQLAPINERLDQLSSQMTSLSDGQKKDYEELKRGFEAALKANAASKGYRVIYMVPPATVLRSVQYRQDVLPGCYYRTWWHQPGGCVYYYRYPYNWHP